MERYEHTPAELVALAREAAAKAHAPYSGFSVGCAIEAEDGSIAIGSNMENACYRLGTCAKSSGLRKSGGSQSLAAISARMER